MKITDFDFLLPEDLIANRPLEERTSSRLLILHRDGGVEHKRFSDLPSYLDKGDMLILNNTKVFPARLTGFKRNGGKVEILLIRDKGDNTWDVLSKGKFTGTLKISDELETYVRNGQTAHFHYDYNGDFSDIVWKCGGMPLPPYIRRLPDESDKLTYQTVFAKKEGSIAAPTAGLHFNESMLKEISSRGVSVRELTLHVGIGTFRPIRTEYVEEHSMDSEYFEMDRDLISAIKETRTSGRKVISVGTTTTRALEGYASGRSSTVSQNGRLRGKTDIFIYPGYSFKTIDALVTNFHLPRSTPLMLASALAGWKNLANAYRDAVARKYRFLSYGDAMLIL
jgi:S-adenosylmethionine:tRNA ribosyltransferase-isomerase